MTIDPRLRERRRDVAEDRAQRNVGRLLKFLGFIMALGGAVWLAYSPWLSVSRVTVTGVDQSDANQTLVVAEVVAGTPMFKINSEMVQDNLGDDPWIFDATVVKNWPDEVIVEVVERTAVAWSRTSEGWTRRAVDGVAIPSDTEPGLETAHIDLPMLSGDQAKESPFMLGALEFIDTLDPALHVGALVTLHESELWATVAGFQVRLGRPIDMAEKARSLRALLTHELEPGSVLVLIAPTNPAVMAPQTPAATSEKGEGEGESDGDA